MVFKAVNTRICGTATICARWALTMAAWISEPGTGAVTWPALVADVDVVTVAVLCWVTATTLTVWVAAPPATAVISASVRRTRSAMLEILPGKGGETRDWLRRSAISAAGETSGKRPSRIRLASRITISRGAATAVSAAPGAAAVIVTLALPMLIVIDAPVIVKPISLNG
jgi:hypothetical protein